MAKQRKMTKSLKGVPDSIVHGHSVYTRLSDSREYAIQYMLDVWDKDGSEKAEEPGRWCYCYQCDGDVIVCSGRWCKDYDEMYGTTMDSFNEFNEKLLKQRNKSRR